MLARWYSSCAPSNWQAAALRRWSSSAAIAADRWRSSCRSDFFSKARSLGQLEAVVRAAVAARATPGPSGPPAPYVDGQFRRIGSRYEAGCTQEVEEFLARQFAHNPQHDRVGDIAGGELVADHGSALAGESGGIVYGVHNIMMSSDGQFCNANL